MRKITPSLMAGVLCILAPPAWTGETFNDVPRNHWAFDEVHWLRADGMLEGWGGKFYGNRKFTRYEMATVLTRYMKKYDAERERVEGELDDLRVEDSRQQGQIKELYSKTGDLEARMAALDGKQSDAARLRPQDDDGTLASAFERRVEPDPVPVPVVLDRDPRIHLQDPEPPAPLEPTPTEGGRYAVETVGEAVVAPTPVPGATSGRQETLQEQIARLRNRIKQRQAARSEGSRGVAPVASPVPTAAPPPTVAPAAPVVTPQMATETVEEDLPPDDLERLRSIRQRFMREMKLRMQMSEVDTGLQASSEEDQGVTLELPSVSMADAGMINEQL